ncbi:hypothetical protein D3C71_1510010 [compost metagenome]
MHRGVGLEFGVAFCHHHQAPQATAQHALGRRQRAHGTGVARRYPRGGGRALRLAPCLDDGLQRGGFVLQIAARHLHQIGNQIVSALELHVDLAKGVGDAVAQLHQPVVDRDGPYQQSDHHSQNDPSGC